MSCPQCHEPFWARDPRQVYCGASCRVLAHRKRKNFTGTLPPWRPGPIPSPMPWRFHEVPVAIVAHPRRKSSLEQLVLSTNAEAVICDDRNYGCDINHLRAWEWLAGGTCPWSVVIEDDALPVARFRYQLHAALQVAPAPIVGLYLGRSRPPQWQRSIAEAVGRAGLEDVCFFTAPALLHGVGYAIRTTLLPDLLQELPSMVADLPIDEAITKWARQRHHRIGYTWPSLVDHRDDPSLVDHRDGHPRLPGRIAWCADWRERWEPTVGEIFPPLQLLNRKEAG